MLISTEKQVKTECMFAFIHSRLSGLMGKGEGVQIFNQKDALNVVVEIGKDIEDSIKEYSTIDIINRKISKSPIALANMYNFHYSKLTKILDALIPTNGTLIEGLIGLHLLVLISKDILEDSKDLRDNIESYEYTISLYENENYTNNEDTKKTVKKMRVVSNIMYEMYWKSKFKKKGK